MSDDTPSPELLQVDPDLMRRVAWGLIVGRSKAEIAAVEEISEEDCRVVCAAPGMLAVMTVWVNFLERRREGGKKYLRKLTGWCVEHVFQHAPERLAKSEIWRLDRLSAVMLDYGFAIVFGWMMAFLDGVMGLPGAKRKDLGDFRQNLIDLLCWAVEVTLRDKMAEQFPARYLAAMDEAFRAAIAEREIKELGIGSDLRTFEEIVAAHAAAQSATGSSDAEAKPEAGPTKRVVAASGPSVSPRPIEPGPAAGRSPEVTRAPIRPPPWRVVSASGRCRLPPMVRPRPIHRAARPADRYRCRDGPPSRCRPSPFVIDASGPRLLGPPIPIRLTSIEYTVTEDKTDGWVREGSRLPGASPSSLAYLPSGQA